MLAVLERLDVVEGVSESFYPSALGACTGSYFKLLEMLSTGLLSQQLRLQLVEEITAYAFNRDWKAWLGYWSPQSE